MTAAEGQATRAWVLHPEILTDKDRRAAGPALDEAVSLARALPHLQVLGADVVRLQRPRPGVLFGTGKVKEIARVLNESGVDLALIDGPVTPVQQRNLEKAWGVKVLDRTGLILEIFSDRAQTREGVLQVEMAALSYQRTRLVRAWTHLERQRGGLGFVGGPGETQIEADRRAIDDAIARIRRQLGKVVRTRELHRAARRKVPYPIVALVGYTNAGKSTFFNRLTGADVLVRDMLFATLDPTMREVVLPSGSKMILSDTVGFISNLPTQLVAAFRATLEEVLEADLIIHVRDISLPGSDMQAAEVARIMAELGVARETPVLEVWNKLDLVAPETRAALQVQAGRGERIFPLSATSGEGMDAVLAAISETLDDRRQAGRLHLGFAEGRRRAWLHEAGVVRGETPTDDGFDIDVFWSARQERRFHEI